MSLATQEGQSQNTIASLLMMTHTEDYGPNEHESTRTIQVNKTKHNKRELGVYFRADVPEAGIRGRDK